MVFFYICTQKPAKTDKKTTKNALFLLLGVDIPAKIADNEGRSGGDAPDK